MRGLLVFNDNHELLYLKADKSLRALLKKRQTEFQYATANAIDDSSSTVSTRAFDGCDPITTAYMFLPLIVCYESMKCMKFDRYVSIRNTNICFYFAESNDDNRLILLAIGDGNTKEQEMNFLLAHFVAALEFSFGPLSYSMSHPSMAAQLDLLTYTLKSFSTSNFCEPDDFLSLESTSDEKTFLQIILKHVDTSGLLKESQTESGRKSPIMAALACIGGQFHAFLKCHLCFLVRKGVLLATFSRHTSMIGAENSNDRKKIDRRKMGDSGEKQHVLAKAWQMITLLRTTTRFGFNEYSGKRQPEPTCSYCYTISLHQHDSSAKLQVDSTINDVFSDVFRIDLTDDIQLICITPVTHGDLMSDLTHTMTMVERLDRLRFEHALLLSSMSTAQKGQKIQTYYDYWLQRLDSHARLLCDRLDDRLIFMDGAKSRKLATTFQNLYRNLREITSTKTRRPDVTRVTHYEGEETSTLKSLRRLAGALLLDTFSAAVDEAKRYKLEKLDRCWRNLISSDLYATTVASLMDCLPAFSLVDEGPPASRFALDALAYIMLLPEKRVLVSNGFQLHGGFTDSEHVLIWTTMHQMLETLKSPSQGIRLKLVAPKKNDTNTREHQFIFLSANHKEKRSQSSTTLLSKLTIALTGDSEPGSRSDDGEPTLKRFIKEPMVIMSVYEPFMNEDLAWRETKLLSIHLYEMMVALSWSFC